MRILFFLEKTLFDKGSKPIIDWVASLASVTIPFMIPIF